MYENLIIKLHSTIFLLLRNNIKKQVFLKKHKMQFFSKVY